jgi:hypothetical protein
LEATLILLGQKMKVRPDPGFYLEQCQALFFLKHLFFVFFRERLTCIPANAYSAIIIQSLHLVIFNLGNRENFSEVVFAEFSDRGMRFSGSEDSYVPTFIQPFLDSLNHGFDGFTNMVFTPELIVVRKGSVKLKINANPAFAFLSWIIRCHLQLLTLCATLRSKF